MCAVGQFARHGHTRRRLYERLEGSSGVHEHRSGAFGHALMRPGRNEIIVCTGLSIRNCGVQYWDCLATGLFHDRRQKS